MFFIINCKKTNHLFGARLDRLANTAGAFPTADGSTQFLSVADIGKIPRKAATPFLLRKRWLQSTLSFRVRAELFFQSSTRYVCSSSSGSACSRSLHASSLAFPFPGLTFRSFSGFSCLLLRGKQQRSRSQRHPDQGRERNVSVCCYLRNSKLPTEWRCVTVGIRSPRPRTPSSPPRKQVWEIPFPFI